MDAVLTVPTHNTFDGGSEGEDRVKLRWGQIRGRELPGHDASKVTSDVGGSKGGSSQEAAPRLGEYVNTYGAGEMAVKTVKAPCAPGAKIVMKGPLPESGSRLSDRKSVV